MTAELTDLEPGHSIIVAGDDGHVQFIQFPENGNGYLSAETISDISYNGGGPLTPEQQQRLAGLGWDEPPAEPPSDGAPGDLAIWRYRLPWPARWNAYERLAGLAVAALREVHGVRTHADLGLGGWGYDEIRPRRAPASGCPSGRRHPQTPEKPRGPTDPAPKRRPPHDDDACERAGEQSSINPRIVDEGRR